MRNIRFALAGSVLFGALAWPMAEAGAAQPSPGSRFLNGETTICLQQGKPMPGGWSIVYKLHASPLASGKKVPLIAVNAVERGTQVTSVVNTYFSELSGTATLAQANNSLDEGEEIQLSLQGTSYGSTGVGDTANTGIYVATYALRLDKRTLDGSIVGYKQFVPVGDTADISTAPTKRDDSLSLLSACPGDLK
jgi:hypothetical protein